MLVFPAQQASLEELLGERPDGDGCSDLVLKSCPTLPTPCTVAHQAPLSKGFPKNTGAGCHFLLQGIFLTLGSNPVIEHSTPGVLQSMES